MRTGGDIPLVKLSTTLREALFEIIEKRVGCTGVIDDNGRLKGIITDGDLKRILVERPDALESPVHELMAPEPKTIPPENLAANALKAMELNPPGPIMMFFVTDAENRPAGIIHMHDILKAGMEES